MTHATAHPSRVAAAVRRAVTRLAASALVVAGAAAAAAPARAQAPAGTAIRARAAGEYLAGPSRERVESNEVVTVVAPVWALALAPSGTVASPAFAFTLADGDTAVATFTLSSLANAPDSAAVAWRVVAGTPELVADVVVFRDADGDGRPGPGETDRAFLALAPGATTPLDVAIVAPPGAPAGDAWVEVSAASTADTTLAPRRAVVRVTVAPRARRLALGPAGNPRADPGGAGSPDDRTVVVVPPGARRVVFENEVLNDAPVDDVVELAVPDSASLPPGLAVTFADTTGAALGPPRVAGTRAVLGVLAAGRARRFRVIVASAGAAPLDAVLGAAPLDVPITARSLLDSTRADDTVDRLAPAPPAPGALLALDQAFREAVVSPGDVATLVVTVRNLSDSTTLERVVVDERVDAVLSLRGAASLSWDAGPLGPGESRTRALKFVAGARIERGDARAVGTARGRRPGGGDVTAPPAHARVRIERDAFASDAFVSGEVFVDGDGDGERDVGEPGVAGAALLLDSGEIAHADSLGRFTFPRAAAGYRVVRLVAAELPDTLAAPGAGPDGAARLVHVLPGMHARVRFALRVAPLPTETVRRSLRGEERVTVRRVQHLYSAFTLPSTHFGLGSARLGAGAAAALEPVAAFLREHPDWGVFVEGHTDSIPIHTARFPSNRELSRARALAVRDRLVEAGVDGARIVVRGLADAQPVATNRTVEGRRANRRVEIAFVPPGVRVDPALARVGATVRDLSGLPDTVRVEVHWVISTDAPTPLAGRLDVNLPPELARARVTARLGDRSLALAASRATFDGLARGRALRIGVIATCPAADTLALSRVRAVLTLRDARVPAEPIVLRPMAWGRSDRRATTSELLAWTATRRVARRAGAARAPERAAPSREPARAAPRRRFGLVEPVDGARVSRRDAVTVRARVPLGARVELSVDGRRVAPGRMGRRTIAAADGVETLTWYGVRLHAGWNRLGLRWHGPGAAGRDSVSVARASAPRTVVADVERVRVPADGRSTATVRLAVRDAFDLGVMDGLAVDVVEGADAVATPDARPSTPGLQVLTRGGAVELALGPARRARRVRVVVACGDARGGVDVVYAPAHRRALAAGVVDVGVGAFSRSGTGSRVGVRDGGLDADGEARVYVRGEAADGVQVTARIDTRGGRRAPLLEDDEAQATYPVYGDGSRVERTARGAGGNYVSIERGESWMRWGDFRTGFAGGEFLRYERATTGLATRMARAGGALRGFVARTRQATRRDEIPADGTSGFYYLTDAPIVEFSEHVVLETRDRFRPERVVDVRPMVRNRDYTINPWDGAILFREPVPVTDAALNPVTIVAIYEVDTRGRDAVLLGVRGDVERRRGAARLRAAAQAVTDDGGGSRYALYGGVVEAAAGAARVVAELARSDDPVQDTGTAWRVRASADGRAGRAEFYHRRVDGAFSNPSFRGAGHELASRKTGVEGVLELGGGVRLEGDGFAHRFERTGERRASARAEVVVARGAAAVDAGVRLARRRAPGDSSDAVLGLAGVRVGEPGRAGVATRVEKNLGGDVVDDYPDRVTTRAALPLARRAVLTLTHEVLGASGRPAGQQLRVGVEARGLRGVEAWSKYSLERIADDARMGALGGVRARVPLGAYTRGEFGVEAFDVAGRDDGDYVTTRAGLTRRVPGRHAALAQLETRRQGARTRTLLRLDGAWQSSRGVGIVLHGAASTERGGDRRESVALRATLAFVHRPVGARTTVVAMARTRYGRHAPDDPDAIRWETVLSADADRHVTRRLTLRLRGAFKHVEDASHGASASADADLVVAQVRWRLAPRWDVDAWVRRLAPHGAGARLDAGLDVGRWVDDAVRVSAGWRSTVIDETGFDAGAARHGLGVRVQVVLSEWLAGRLREVAR